MSPRPSKVPIGDAIYAEVSEGQLTLTVENGGRSTQRIVLTHQVFRELVRFLDSDFLKEEIRNRRQGAQVASERDTLLDILTACNIQLLMQLRGAPDAGRRAWQLHETLEYELKKAGR